ncbi:hypothetical protein UlMin_041546 [Ulmus minor]
MAAASASSAQLFGNREEDQNQMTNQHSSTPTSSAAQPGPPQKKKRNQPGTPNPDAEVIALSPKTLMATNRFICEVCNKGFQREQNLQLHRRGHNLPWKLKQKSNKEPKRKVYLCPEPTCVHHDPSRALGDLTGIKKHYSRKHGEKKWKCEKCSKRYAVQSDWKAHSKTCGTREYRCDCGTLFSRRDSFITHRAFCDALAQESARQPPNLTTIGSNLFGSANNTGLGLSQVGPQFSSIQDGQNINQQTNNDLLRLGSGRQTGQFDHILSPSMAAAASSFRQPQPSGISSSSAFFMPDHQSNQQYQDQDHHHHHPHQHQSQHGFLPNKPFHGLMQFSEPPNNATSNNPPSGLLISNHMINNENGSGSGGGEGSNIFSNHIVNEQINSGAGPSLYSTSMNNNPVSASAAHMSATALLQKAAQMGSTSSNNNTASLLRSFGSSSSTSANKASNFGGIFAPEDETNNLHDLMNSFPGSGGGSSIFGNTFSGYDQTRRGSLDEPKLQQNLSGVTRDFLGVGQIVRSMSGGFSKQQHHQVGMEIGSLDSKSNAAPSSQSFGGGNFQ